MLEKVDKFLTTKVVFHGPGSLNRLESEIRKLGRMRPALITDPGVAKSGIRDQVLAAAKMKVFCFEEVEPEPPYTLVAHCVDFLRQNQCDLVIGLGGGSSIDMAKMSAVMMGNTGDVPDYFGADRVPKPGLPVIAIPTTAGTGSEVSPACVFVDPRDQAKKGVRSDFILPEVAILDPVLTLSLPQPLTASTGMDALTHAIECYTAVRATFMSDLMAEHAIRLIGENLRAAYANGNDLTARTNMLMGSFVAGIALAISNVGGVHSLAQAMGGMYRVPHGVANALFLPYVMEFNRIACQAKYARVAELLGERTEGLSVGEASQKAVAAVRMLTQDLGLPQHIRDVGDIPEDALDLIAQRCIETQVRILTNNPRTISLAEAKQILKMAF